jgi:hypothetical protein
MEQLAQRIESLRTVLENSKDAGTLSATTLKRLDQLSMWAACPYFALELL